MATWRAIQFYLIALKCNTKKVWVILKLHKNFHENPCFGFPLNCRPIDVVHFPRWLPGGHFVLSDGAEKQSQARLGHTEAVYKIS